MGVIWFKNRPKPIALTPDGRLNLVPFKLDPDTIAINGIEGLVALDVSLATDTDCQVSTDPQAGC